MADLILSPIPVRPCIKCGATDRSKTGACKPCAKARAAAWYVKNAERINANSIAWQVANPERKKAIHAAWRARNPDRVKADSAAWYAANIEKSKASVAAWRVANPERAKAIADAWYAENQERFKATSAAWRAANPEAHRIQSHNRRARQKENGGRLSSGLASKLFKLQKGKCPCCKQPLGGDYHLDHIMPIALGGTNTDDNIQLLRSTCNQQKHCKEPILFMQSRGFLL